MLFLFTPKEPSTVDNQHDEMGIDSGVPSALLHTANYHMGLHQGIACCTLGNVFLHTAKEQVPSCRKAVDCVGPWAAGDRPPRVATVSHATTTKRDESGEGPGQQSEAYCEGRLSFSHTRVPLLLGPVLQQHPAPSG